MKALISRLWADRRRRREGRRSAVVPQRLDARGRSASHSGVPGGIGAWGGGCDGGGGGGSC